MTFDVDKFVNGLVEYLQKRDKEYNEFFESEEFNGLIKIIQGTPIDEESLRYETQKVEGLNSSKYTKLCDTIFHRFENEARLDGESPFPKYVVDYKGVRFHLMIGQGAAYWSEPLIEKS